MDGGDVGGEPDGGWQQPWGLIGFCRGVFIAAFLICSVVLTERQAILWSGTKLAIYYSYSSSSEEHERERGNGHLLLAHCFLLCVLLLPPWLGAGHSLPMRTVAWAVGVLVLIVDYLYVHA